MKRTLVSHGVFILGAGLAFAGTLSGQLLDANCVTRQATAACVATSATTAFAFGVNETILKLDTAETFKSYNSSGERAKEPNSQSFSVTATVQAPIKGNQIKVDSIDIR